MTNLIFQLPEHIKAHYKTWLDVVNEKVSATLSIKLTKRVRELLQAIQLHHALPKIPTAQPQPLADTVCLPPSTVPADSESESSTTNVMQLAWQLNHQLEVQPDNYTGQQVHSLHYCYQPERSDRVSTESGAGPSSSHGGLKRPASDTAENERTIKKSKRKCTYCSSAECKGRGGQRFCPRKVAGSDPVQ